MFLKQVTDIRYNYCAIPYSANSSLIYFGEIYFLVAILKESGRLLKILQKLIFNQSFLKLKAADVCILASLK